MSLRILNYESRFEPLLGRWAFAWRMAASCVAAAGLIGVSLFVGMCGYKFTEGMPWVDAFENAAMILSGMGPVTNLETTAGKIFAGSYALYSGLVLIFAAGLILAPVAHRLLHRFHLGDADEN
jgi:hypothetical protein